MIRVIKFVKEPSNDWYAVLPEWLGDKCELQMVMGADSWLDVLSQGEAEVELAIGDDFFHGAEELNIIEIGKLEGPELGTGAWYLAKSYIGIEYDLKLWLCDVTKFVFGYFPTTLYYKK